MIAPSSSGGSGGPAKSVRIIGFLLFAILLSTCGEQSQSPSGPPQLGSVSLAPVFPSGRLVGGNLPIDHAHVLVVRPPNTTVKDTTVLFDANADRLNLNLTVLLRAQAESLDVTIELLSGSQVLFSTTQRAEVASGTNPRPALQLPLAYVGPGSQVASLVLAPLDSSLTQGDSLAMRITGLDGSQQPVPQFYVSWSSSDSNLAKVNGDGIVAARAATGAPYIRARTPPSTGFPQGVVESTTVVLQSSGGGSGVTTWTGNLNSDWSTAGNWSGGAVPSATDSAVIVAATNHPTLSTTVVVGAVHVAGGILELNGFGLGIARGFTTSGNGILLMTNPSDVMNVTGDALFNGGNELGSMSDGFLGIGGDLTQLNGNSNDSFHPSGNHITAFTGPSPTISFATPGIVPGSSHFQQLVWSATGGSTMTLNSNVFAHSAMTVTGAGSFTISGTARSLSVGAMINIAPVTLSGVRLTIDQPTGTFGADLNNLTFQGQSTTGVQLQINHPGVGSPFTLTNLAFATTPTTGFYLGVTDVNPTDGQVLTVNLSSPTPAAPGAFVQTTGGAVVNWPFPAPGGGLRTWTGSINTDWSNPGNWSPATVPTANDTVVINPATNDPQLTAGSVASTVTVSGSGANLTLNGHPLTLGGDLVVSNNGLLTMANPADALTVNGNATWQGGDESGLLSAGTFTLKGNFAQNNGSFQTFASSGTAVVLNGTSLQTVSFGAPSPTQSRFQDLTLNNPAGVQFNSSVFVSGNLLLSGTTPLTDAGAVTLTVQGVLTSPAGTSVNLNALTAAQAPVIGGTYSVGTTTYSGNLTVPSIGYGNLVINGVATAAANFGVLGNLTVSGSGADFILNGHTISVVGSLVVASSGLVTISNPADNLTVLGNATFQGGDETTHLLGGTLTVSGNFAQNNGSFQAFAAVGTAVVLSGGTHQTVSFGAPSISQSRFQDLTINNAAGVTFNSNVVVMGNLLVNGTTPLTDNGGPLLTVQGTLTSAASASVTLSNLSTPNAPVIGGTYAVGTTFYTGTGMNFPVLPYTNLQLSGTGTPAGDLTLTGNLTVTNSGANFTAGGHTVTIGGNLVVASSGVLTMTNGLDQVIVNGSATFQGGDETGLLSAGTLTVNGNFAQNNGSFQAFASTGTAVVLNGTTQQAVSFGAPSAGQSRFQNLTANNPGGVRFNSNVFVAGNFTLNGTTPLTDAGGTTLTVQGTLTSAAGASVTLSNLSTPTAPVIGGTYNVGTTFYTGTGMTFPVLPYTAINLTGDGTPSGNLTLGGNLTVTGAGANFTVGGHTITMGGSLLVASSGLFTMTNAADQVTVNGGATFQGGDESTLLTAGTLTVKGDFAQNNGSFQAFAASGTTVVLNGISQQAVSFGAPSSSQSRFQNLTVNNPAGIRFNSNVFVAGNVTLNGTTPLTDAGGTTLTVQGTLTSAPGTGINLSNFSTPNAPVIGGTYAVGTTFYTGTGMSLPVLAYSSMQLTGTGTPAGNLTLNGNLTVTGAGANFTVGGRTISISGNLLVSSSALFTMTSAGDQVTVIGNATFQGGDESAALTAGNLTVQGNFTQANGSFQAFASTGTSVLLNGTTQQTVSFGAPSGTQSRFQNLTANNPAGVRFTSNVFVAGNLNLNGTTPLTESGGTTLTTVGTLTSAAGTSITLTNFSTPTNPVIAGGYIVGTTIYTGSGMSFPVLTYTRITLTGSGTPAGNLTLAGDLQVTNSGANFTVGGRTVTIGGNLLVISSGLLTMTNGADQVTVNGDATFQGGDESTSLTAGTITLQGDFTQNNGSFQAFAATGTHKVVLNGTGNQVISFGAPGTSQSRFMTLDVTQNTGGVTITSSVVVNLQLISGVGPGAPPKISGGGNVLTTVSGAVARLVLDHTQLVVNEQGTGHAQQWDNLTFQNFPTTANSEIFFNVTAVGGAATPRNIPVNTTTLQTSLGSGGTYVKAVSSNGFGLNVIMNNSNDTSGGPARSNPPNQTTVGGATVLWQ